MTTPLLAQLLEESTSGHALFDEFVDELEKVCDEDGDRFYEILEGIEYFYTHDNATFHFSSKVVGDELHVSIDASGNGVKYVERDEARAPFGPVDGSTPVEITYVFSPKLEAVRKFIMSCELDSDDNFKFELDDAFDMLGSASTTVNATLSDVNDNFGHDDHGGGEDEDEDTLQVSFEVHLAPEAGKVAELKAKLQSYNGDLEFTVTDVEEDEDGSSIYAIASDPSSSHDEESIRDEIEDVITKIFGKDNITDFSAAYTS